MVLPVVGSVIKAEVSVSAMVVVSVASMRDAITRLSLVDSASCTEVVVAALFLTAQKAHKVVDCAVLMVVAVVAWSKAAIRPIAVLGIA